MANLFTKAKRKILGDNRTDEEKQREAESDAEKKRLSDEGDRLGVDRQEVARREDERARMAQGKAERSAAAHSSTSQSRRDQIAREREEAANRAAPTSQAATSAAAERMRAAQVDESRIRSGGEDMRAGQQSLISQLQAQAAGQGPSLAQNQLQRGTDRNLQQLLAAQAASRGGLSGAAAQRQLARNQAGAGQVAAGQSADLALNEQLAARQQLAGVLGAARQQDIGLRGQDIGLQSTQAGLTQQERMANQAAGNQFARDQAARDQQTALANQAAELQNQAQVDALRAKYLEMGMSQEEADRRARMEVAKMNQAAEAQQQNTETQRYAVEEAGEVSKKDLLGIAVQAGGGILGGAGAALGLPGDKDSDRNLKKNIKSDDSVADFLSALSKKDKNKGTSPMQALASSLTNNSRRGSIVEQGAGFLVGPGAAASIRKAEQGRQGHTPRATRFTPSDRDLKEGISDNEGEIKSFLDALTSYTYQYKDKDKHGEGRHAGVMAQDLEKAGPLGQAIVKEMPHGKVVDYAQGMSTILSGLVHVNDRLKDIEARKSKRSSSKGRKK